GQRGLGDEALGAAAIFGRDRGRDRAESVAKAVRRLLRGPERQMLRLEGGVLDREREDLAVEGSVLGEVLPERVERLNLFRKSEAGELGCQRRDVALDDLSGLFRVARERHGGL